MGFEFSIGTPTVNHLADRFVVPPMSVLDGRVGSWQDRKRAWISAGIREDFRNAKCINLGNDGKDSASNYTSIFDPVLTEILYRWFCPEAGAILDPFAGGVARGFVAGTLGYGYYGIDLSLGQVEHNRNLCASKLPEKPIKYVVGDSDQVLAKLQESGSSKFDFVIACPPYLDLEKYSDDPDDLSNMSHESFASKYESVIHGIVSMMHAGSFAAFVVGPVRRPDGWYTDLASMTSNLFSKFGCPLYNSMVLLTPIGSTSLRAEITYTRGDRKIARCHQDVLVFRKPNIEGADE